MRVALLVALAACKPDVDVRAALVTHARVLAARAEPAEAPPGTDVHYTLLVGAPEGTVVAPAAAWAFCTSPKPLTENDVVGADCLYDAAQPIGQGPEVTAKIPANACQLFGPDPPPGGFRPRDPDPTGGYYQPLRALFGEGAAIVLSRVACNLGDAPADAAADFGKRYHANQNPTVTAALPASARPGERVVLRATWRAEDAETYVMFDHDAQAVVTRREAIRASWFATAGAFDVDRTGRAEDDPATVTENAWVAPDLARTAHVWIVLRDSRGGVAWTGGDIEVR